jgi:hypothetical protein
VGKKGKTAGRRNTDAARFATRSTAVTPINSAGADGFCRRPASTNARAPPLRTYVSHTPAALTCTTHHRTTAAEAGATTSVSPPGHCLSAISGGGSGGSLIIHGDAGTSAGSAYTSRASAVPTLSRSDMSGSMEKCTLPVTPGRARVART